MKEIDPLDVKLNIKAGLLKCVVKDGKIYLETDVGERFMIGEVPKEE